MICRKFAIGGGAGEGECCVLLYKRRSMTMGIIQWVEGL